MTLGELRDALAELLNTEGIDEDDHFGIELTGERLEPTTIAAVVSSKHWEDGMVVITVNWPDTEEEGEADDG